MTPYYTMLNESSNQPIFMSSEHAGKIIPEKFGTLGVKPEELNNNPDFCDQGADTLARKMAALLNARCILSKFSRLVVNLNKPDNHPKLVNAEAFGLKTPGNANLTHSQIRERLEYYYPYHNRIKDEIKTMLQQHDLIYYVCVHTFFHKIPEKAIPEETRDIDIGILFKYDKDREFCVKIQKELAKKNLVVKMNEPYSARKTAGYTMNMHGNHPNIRCVEFEINDKHVKTKEGAAKMAAILSDVIKEVTQPSQIPSGTHSSPPPQM